jgi:general secretion pathway protein E
MAVQDDRLTPPESGATRLGELLLTRGAISPEALARARLVQQETHERFDAILTRLGLISERALAEALAAGASAPLLRAEDFPVEALAAADLSPTFLRDIKALPLHATARGVAVAFADPWDDFARRSLAYILGAEIEARVAAAGDIEAAIDRLYGAAAAVEDAPEASADVLDLERLKDLASEAPAVRAVNSLINRAAEVKASDIHIEPTEAGLRVRFRIDGVLQTQPPLPPSLKAALVSRVKVMAGLNIAERRLPQDGRLRVAVRGNEIDLRVATSPTIHGETVVMRLLDRSNLALDFDILGFDPQVRERYLDVLSNPHGILLVTGPTGSGKTTTLYASLSSLNSPERKILTIEDPIEYRLEGINQTQVTPQIGLTFAAALRSFLRQDPDVMMVGEIRDLETAQVAVQAALTGHLVLATLHTNDAPSAVTRLIDMGMEPFLITSTLNAVLAQRLVRRLCPHCAAPFEPPASWLATLSIATGLPVSAAVDATRLRRPVGCVACEGTGYQGRVAVTELLVMDETLTRLVLEQAEARAIGEAARRAGMRSMLQDGSAKVLAGQTTLEEVMRVTRDR